MARLSILNSSNWYVGLFEGKKVFIPDFEKAEMKDWWGQQLKDLEENVLKQTVPDGYILTHNSPKLENASNCDFTGELAFAPLVAGGQQNLLGNQTICPTAMHFNGQKHIKMHNDFGTSHAEAIRKLLYTHSSSPGISSLGFVVAG